VTATSKRRYLRDLPKWFDLKKYECAAALDAPLWYFQIAIRSTCFFQLHFIISAEPHFSEWDDPILKALASLRSNPIAVPNSPPFDHKAFSWCHEIPVSAVRSMTRLDLYSIDRQVRQRLTPTEIEHTQWLVKHESPAAFALARTDYLNASLDEDCVGLTNLPIMIDLRFPNKVLRQHFEIYLQGLRQRKGGRPEEAKKHSPDVDKWGKAGLLPCLDLLLWEKELDGRVPDSVLAKALGRQGQVDRETIRKTVRPWAEALVSVPGTDSTQIRLGALAYSDLAERAQVRHRRSAKRQSTIASAKASTT
jgi:hypothetical protein